LELQLNSPRYWSRGCRQAHKDKGEDKALKDNGKCSFHPGVLDFLFAEGLLEARVSKYANWIKDSGNYPLVEKGMERQMGGRIGKPP